MAKHPDPEAAFEIDYVQGRAWQFGVEVPFEVFDAIHVHPATTIIQFYDNKDVASLSDDDLRRLATKED